MRPYCFRPFLISLLIFSCLFSYIPLGLADSLDLSKVGLNKTSSISVVDLTNGGEVFSTSSDLRLMPASTLKIVTSVVALAQLGSNFTFRTGVFSQESKSGGLSITIRGGGDPELTTERAYLLSRRIKLSGVRNLKRLILDTSALTDPSSVQGQRAYQTGSAALSFNFNSIGIQICPPKTKRNSKPDIQPLVWEDRLNLLNAVEGTSGSQANLSLSLRAPSSVEVRGIIGADSSCVDRYLSNKNPTYSLGRFLKSALEEMGVGKDIELSTGQIQSAAVHLFDYQSKPLSDLLVGLNHFSTNVSAEQILSAIGSGAVNENLSRTKGLEKLLEFLAELGFGDTTIEDGSGLSRSNRISTKALNAVLKFAWNDPKIRPYLEASLPILGHSGTLKKRQMDPKGDYQVFAKSGTLDGVSSLSGYLHLRSGRSYAFSFIQNEVVDIVKAHRLEEELLQSIAHKLS